MGANEKGRSCDLPFRWLPLLGSNHATLFRYAQRRVCFLFYKKANVAQRNMLRNHDVLSVQAKQKKKTKESNRLVTLFCLAPPAGLEPATSWLTVMRSTDWAKEEYLKGYLKYPLCRLWPIFPGRLQPSIFGTAKLNFRVRNGNGWTLCVKITDSLRFVT